ncbi:MAG: type II toxin-antitoxin system prevent-host-death family antitoxin [Candidatus Bipolaricaulota bacterium]|nr:type II toxin-antitoxin system prevent-host-death family antitoxin [Candidatus Bipolaricaulota bacterium]
MDKGCDRTRVGVRELRNGLSEYLARVKKGERIEVTQRGEAIALLLPLPSEDRTASALLELVLDGAVSWSGGKPRGAESLLVVRGRPLSRTVLEDRR